MLNDSVSANDDDPNRMVRNSFNPFSDKEEENLKQFDPNTSD
jgi:hypothetical protein